nr:mitochondrial genome maintenance protein [Quercus suber]
MSSPAVSRKAAGSLLSLLPSPVSRASGSFSCSRQLHLRLHRRSVSSSKRCFQQAPPQSRNPAVPSQPIASANTAAVEHDLTPSSESHPLRSLTDGLEDPLPNLSEEERQVDWTRSFHGLSAIPFNSEQAMILQQELEFDDIEVKPDGIVYLPEIKYRRILNKAFGPGGWGLAPRGETIVTGKMVTRELISVARGEQQYFDPEGIPTATEGCKSNALMRCCKDIGIASELWDPRFIRKFLKEHARETIVEHQTTKKRRKHWMRSDDEVKWPFKDVGSTMASSVNVGNVSAPPATFPGTRSTPSGYTSKLATTTLVKPSAGRTASTTLANMKK